MHSKYAAPFLEILSHSPHSVGDYTQYKSLCYAGQGGSKKGNMIRSRNILISELPHIKDLLNTIIVGFYKSSHTYSFMLFIFFLKVLYVKR